VGSLAEVGNDVMNLAELQAKLVALDAREAASRATLPVTAVGLGLVIAAASVPVALLGLADILARTLQILPGWADAADRRGRPGLRRADRGRFHRQIPMP